MSDVKYDGGLDLPAHPWSAEQFALAVTDDAWLDRQAAELDKAVEKAVGTSGLAVIETARGVITAMRRRRSGEPEAFGVVVKEVSGHLNNENNRDIRFGGERDEDGMVRTWMESDTSRVENIMTHSEAIGLFVVLEEILGVQEVSAAEIDEGRERDTLD